MKTRKITDTFKCFILFVLSSGDASGLQNLVVKAVIADLERVKKMGSKGMSREDKQLSNEFFKNMYGLVVKFDYECRLFSFTRSREYEKFIIYVDPVITVKDSTAAVANFCKLYKLKYDELQRRKLGEIPGFLLESSWR